MRFVRATLLSATAVALAAYDYVATRPPGHTTTPAAAAAASQPVPVLAAKAETKDVPIFLRGLGTVTAFNTVELKSRVEGAITEINFKEGQAVHKGDLLIQLDPRPYQAALDEAKGTLTKDQAGLKNANLNLSRYGDLLNHGFTPQQQFDAQQTTVSQDQSSLVSDRAAIDAAELNVEYTALRSPIDGVTGIRQVDIGNLIQANNGQNLLTITQIKPIYVVFTLPEIDIGKVRRAMAQHPVPVEVFRADDTTKVAEGVLNLVDNTVNATTGTVELKAEFKNDNGALWPGEFVNAHAVLKVAHDAVTVPASAVQTGPNGPYTYVVDAQSKAEVRPIKVGQTEADTVLVTEGLKAGEQVVTGGQFKLDANSAVTVSKQIADTGQKLTDAPVGTDASP